VLLRSHKNVLGIDPFLAPNATREGKGPTHICACIPVCYSSGMALDAIRHIRNPR
jgi:hypothetical protein